MIRFSLRSVCCLFLFPLLVNAKSESPRFSPVSSSDTNGLVRHYPFDAGSGDWAEQIAGDGEWPMMLLSNSPYGVPNDLRAHRFRGPVVGTSWHKGRFPGTYSIRPGETPNSVVRSQFYSTETGSLAIELWVRFHPDGGQRGPIVYAGDVRKGGYQLERSYSRITWEIATSEGSVLLEASEIEPKLWYHVVVSWDATEQRTAMYLNGQLVDEKAVQGSYLPPLSQQASWQKMPEQDMDGFRIGGVRSSQIGAAKFDLDEVKIYDRALSGEEIATGYEKDKPGLEPDAARVEFDLEMQQEAVLEQIRLEIPTESYGYFPENKDIPLTFEVPANSFWHGELTTQWHVENMQGELVKEGSNTLSVSADKSDRLDLSFENPSLGLYFLKMEILDGAGGLIKSMEYPIGIIKELPAIADLPETSPLASHCMIERCPESAAVGFGKVERLIRNAGIGRASGSYDFAYEDEIIAEAVARDMQIMLCLNAVPDVLDEDPNSDAFNLYKYKQDLAEVVRRYRDEVDFWEILNEPNSGHHTATLGITPQARARKYVAILKAAYEVVRAEDPTAKVVGISGCPGFVPWLEQVLAAGGAPYFDIVTIHNYRPAPIQTSNREDEIGQVRKILERYGKESPIWNGEFGLKKPSYHNGRPMTEEYFQKKYKGRFNFRYGQPFVPTFMPMRSPHVVAAWTIQSILLDLADGCERVFQLAGPGNAYPNYVSDGLPSEKGVAMAAAASLLIDLDQIQRLPMASVRDAAAVWTTLDGRRFASVFSDDSSAMVFHVGDLERVYGMDMLGESISWPVNNGTIRVKVGMEPVYFLDVPEDFALVPVVEVGGSGVLEGAQTEDFIVYKNPTNTPQTYHLSYQLPEGIQIATQQVIEVLAGDTVRVPYVLKAKDLKRGLHELEFSLSDAEGVLLANTQYMLSAADVTVSVPHIQDSIALDANPEQWQGISAVHVNDVDDVLSGKPVPGVPWAPQWKGESDLSFTYRMAWHEEDGLMFLIEVVDDQFRPAPDQASIFQYDGIELFLDVRPHDMRKVSYTPGAEQIMVRAEGGDLARQCYVKSSASGNSQMDVQFVGRQTENGYILEGRIKPIDGAPWKIESGLEFAFDLFVDDADEHLRKTIMGIGYGGLDNAKQSDKWGWYRLVENAEEVQR